MIMESVIQENTTIQNIHAPNSGAHNVIKSVLMELKAQFNTSPINVIPIFNFPH